jgi:hypothetical protein
MFGISASGSGETGIDQMQNTAINLVDILCSIIAEPIEILLRPWYGSRYLSVPVKVLAMAMMVLLPAIAALFSGTLFRIPFINIPPPRGMFDLGAFAKVYFLVSFAHGFRVWRRMMHPELEIHSQFEGPALPFFALLWKGTSFWVTRILWEPLFVVLASIALEDLFIIQHPLGLYLRFAAFALMVKSFISWYGFWEFTRIQMDIQNTAPALAEMMSNKSSPENSEPHYASLPRNIDPEIRRAAASRIARMFTPQKPQPKPEEGETK